MGWFFRRSFKMGPFLRLNLSHKGVGFSAGVPGARLSVSPSAQRTVTAGRFGLFYRKVWRRRNVVNNTDEEVIDVVAKKADRTMRGRKSLYRGKDREGRRIGGIMTKRGLTLIEQSRSRLAALANRPAEDISDSDLIEYLGRKDNNVPVFDN